MTRLVQVEVDALDAWEVWNVWVPDSVAREDVLDYINEHMTDGKLDMALEDSGASEYSVSKVTFEDDDEEDDT